MPTRSGPRPDPGAAVAGGGEEGTGRKPQFLQPPQAGGACSPAGRPGSRASGASRRGAAPLQVWEKQPPAPWPSPSDLLGKMLGWASGLSGRHRSCSFPCFRNVQPAPGLRSCRAAAGRVCGRGRPGAERRPWPTCPRVAHCLEPEGICIRGGPEAPHRKTEMWGLPAAQSCLGMRDPGSGPGCGDRWPLAAHRKMRFVSTVFLF